MACRQMAQLWLFCADQFDPAYATAGGNQEETSSTDITYGHDTIYGVKAIRMRGLMMHSRNVHMFIKGTRAKGVHG